MPVPAVGTVAAVATPACFMAVLLLLLLEEDRGTGDVARLPAGVTVRLPAGVRLTTDEVGVADRLPAAGATPMRAKAAR